MRSAIAYVLTLGVRQTPPLRACAIGLLAEDLLHQGDELWAE
jgi:hypothetical protein